MSETAQVSSLPLPPLQFINLYSEENLKRGRNPRPPPPITDSYSMFGTQFHADDAVIRPLESQGIRRLYPNNYDHRRELKKLNHSIMASFLDLVDILIRNPESGRRAEKLDDLTLLFIHMHHLVNEFRPHQARETLRVMMEQQKRQRYEIADRFERHLERAFELVRQAVSNLPELSESSTKFLIDTVRVQLTDNRENRNKKAANSAECTEEDQLMCNIVDAM
nr:EOG090X0EJA [Eulimnadia texana]